MNFNLNSIIKRKKYDNYLKNGVGNMNYRISEELSKKAEQIIIEDEINEGLNDLKSQIKSLKVDKDINKVTLTDMEINDIRKTLNDIDDGLGVLNFKKENLKVLLNSSLSNIDIKESIKLKEEIQLVENEIDKFSKTQSELNSKIKNSESDYDLQMVKIREKYKDKNILDCESDNEFNTNVIIGYKKEVATNLVKQFLETLSEEKQKQILSQNEDLKGYVDVGENI